MAITFTSTRAGSSPDYMRYLYGDLNGLTKTDKYMQATLLDFALAPVDTQFVRLDRGAYIKVDSTLYPNWFTGYITNEPSLSYLGMNSSKQAVYGYKYEATSDEYILSMKPLGIVPPFLNVPMGTILKTLVDKILPGVFDVTNIADGPIVAQYVVTPDKYFKDIFKDLCTQASYIFWGNDHKLYFKPQDDASLGSITLDGNDKHFTPSRLSIRPSSAPIINDVTVLGSLEPQTYMHEYFVGTGLQSSFPLTAGVFGADNCLLLQDNFQSAQIDTTKWVVYQDGAVVLNTAQNTFQPFNSYLNVVASGMGYGTWIQGLSAVPLEGRMRFTHGEWDFLSTQSALIGCVWSQTPNSGLTGCLYGLQMNGATLNPIVGGVVDGSQFVTVSSAMRYIIRTVVEFTKHVRVPNKYTYLDASGVLQSVSSAPVADNAVWQTLISEVDPTNGTLVSQWSFKNTASLNGTTDIYGIYTPVVVDAANLTVSNISVSIPVCCTLETATDIGLVNGSFDAWDDETSPSGWVNPLNVIQETTWSDTDMAVRIHDGGTIEQDVSSLLTTGIGYTVQFRVMQHVGGSGSLTMQLYGTGMAPVGPTFNFDTDITTSYKTITAKLTDALTSIPVDCKFKITASSGGYNPVWVDSLTIYSDFQHQLVGPNEMDAMDGLAPVATIVSGNANSQTKSTFTGSPQYNPGQDQLVFFKNSVTLTSDTPPENQIIRLSYRAAGSAVGRVTDAASITTEQSLYEDDGVRSTVRTDISPRPRTSLECELAAKAIVAENSFQHYEGTYTQFSTYFTQTPRAGMPIIFTNHPGIPFIQAEEIQQVVSTAICNHGTELFTHAISFGKPDHIQRFLSKVETPIDSYQQNPASPYADPAYVDVATVGSNYIEDVTKPYLVNWDEKFIYIDVGQDLSADATSFEVRYTDEGWGKGAGKNLLVSTTGRSVDVPRNPRGRVFFIRQVNSVTGATSRYSACMNIAFPTVVSNAYIRDWLCEVIDLANPLAVGIDLSNNRYKVKIEAGTQVYLQEWHMTLKTPATGSAVTADILLSTDLGATWASIFPITPKPNCPRLITSKVGTQFQTRFLNRNDLLRYDLTATDGTAAGLTLDLIGRVMATGAIPLGAHGNGTGSTGAPTGSTTSTGTTSGGIGAEYLFNEGGGTILHDTSGLHRDGSLSSNQPSWDAGANALDFTNTNQSVQLPDTTLSIDSNTVRDFTIEVWVKPIAASGTVLDFGNSSGLTLYWDTFWHLTGSTIPFTITSTSPVVLNEWSQIVVTRVNNTVTMYVNHVQDATLAANNSPLGLGSGSKYLGQDPATSTDTPGAVMDLGVTRFYSSGLSATQVTQNWNSTAGTYGLAGTGGGTGGGGGSTGSTSSADQIHADMVGNWEGTPHGWPYGTTPFANSFPNGDGAIEFWSVLYVDAGGNPAANSQAVVRNAQVWWFNTSTNQWVNGYGPSNSWEGQYYPEDYSSGAYGSIPFGSNADGTTYTTVAGKVAHSFAPFPRVPVNAANYGGVVVLAEAKLALINPSGTDDRSSAQLLFQVGADPYPGTTGAGIENNPGLVGGKMKYLGTEWRSFAATDMSQAALEAHPPPIDLTGISG
jgi:hypothetical protein